MLRRALGWLFDTLERPLARDALTAAEVEGRAGSVGEFSRTDVIVVLGAPCPLGRPGRFATERARAAAALYRAGVAPRVLVTGGMAGRSGGQSEAACLGRLLQQLGVAPADVVLEEAARNTDENARFSATLAQAQGWQRAVVVTQRWHVRRALCEFRRAGFDASAIELGGEETRRRPLRGLWMVVREYLAWTRHPLR